MTNRELAGFYAKLCAALLYVVPHNQLAPHASNAREHEECADSPHFDREATREGIKQVLTLACVLPL